MLLFCFLEVAVVGRENTEQTLTESDAATSSIKHICKVKERDGQKEEPSRNLTQIAWIYLLHYDIDL
jgi:hypothetical protein